MMAQPSVAALHGITPPVPVISPQFCCPYPVDLAIVRKIMAIAGGNFTVTDTNGTLFFQVKEKFLTLHEKKTILDALGNPIVTLREKAMSTHSRWQVFRGASTDPKDLIFTAKTHSVFDRKTKLEVFLAHNTAEEVCDFQVKGSNRECVVYAGDHEDSNTIVAKMHKKHTAQSIFLGKDQFMVTVYPNMDRAFIVALIVILDDIKRHGRDDVKHADDHANGGGTAVAEDGNDTADNTVVDHCHTAVGHSHTAVDHSHTAVGHSHTAVDHSHTSLGHSHTAVDHCHSHTAMGHCHTTHHF